MRPEKSQDDTPAVPSRGWILAQRRARRLAVLAVFAKIHTQEPMTEVQTLLRLMAKTYNSFPEFARELCSTVEMHREELERDLESVLENWRLERIGRVEHAILLLGAAEIAYFPDIPPRVTINEYLEISKIYCDRDAPAFINGVLDKIKLLKQKQDFYIR